MKICELCWLHRTTLHEWRKRPIRAEKGRCEQCGLNQIDLYEVE